MSKAGKAAQAAWYSGGPVSWDAIARAAIEADPVASACVAAYQACRAYQMNPSQMNGRAWVVADAAYIAALKAAEQEGGE